MAGASVEAAPRWTAWGTTEADLGLSLPCDRYAHAEADVWHRAVDVDAPPGATFRWLCQLRAAPYSYDWIDNLGRRSPRTLTPGLDRLAVGQRVMGIFELVEYEGDRHVTIRQLDRLRRLVGEVAVTYVVLPRGGGRSRLVVRLVVVRHPGPRVLRPLVRRLYPLGDLIMMRKQLLTLKRLAERDASIGVAASPQTAG